MGYKPPPITEKLMEVELWPIREQQWEREEPTLHGFYCVVVLVGQLVPFHGHTNTQLTLGPLMVNCHLLRFLLNVFFFFFKEPHSSINCFTEDQ